MKGKFDPDTLQTFDKVLVRCNYGEQWVPQFFSRWDYDMHYHRYAKCIGDEYSALHYDEVIPYNDETKHLCHKSDEAPEYYAYWMCDYID